MISRRRHCISPATGSRCVTGTVLPVDGGAVAGKAIRSTKREEDRRPSSVMFDAASQPS